MGEITEMILDGVLCELCGVYLGQACGYPRKCKSCAVQTTKKPYKKKRKKKTYGGHITWLYLIQTL